MDDLAGWHLVLDGIKETDELLMRVSLHAAAEDDAVEDIEGGKQGGRAVPLVVVGHGAALAGLERQTGLGSIERLNLALLIDREDDGMGGRVHIEPDDILDLLAEGWVLRPLEGAPPVGLEVMRFPNPLDRSQRQVDDLGHRPTGPVSGLPWRLSARQRQYLCNRGGRYRRLSRLAASLAQEPIDAFIGIVPLPAPNRGTADARASGDLESRQPVCRVEDDPGTLHVFERQASIADDRGQPRVILSTHDHGHRLTHATRIARPRKIVNPMIVSVH